MNFFIEFILNFIGEALLEFFYFIPRTLYYLFGNSMFSRGFTDFPEAVPFWKRFLAGIASGIITICLIGGTVLGAHYLLSL